MREKRSGLTIFFLGLIIGGILFGSVAFFVTNYRMEKLIDEKIGTVASC